jgi:hypothetical protein
MGEKNRKSGFIDKTGKEVIFYDMDTSEHPYMRGYSYEGLAGVLLDEQNGFMDREGYFIGQRIVKKIPDNGGNASTETETENTANLIAVGNKLPSAYFKDGEAIWNIGAEDDELGTCFPQLILKENGNASYHISDGVACVGTYPFSNNVMYLKGTVYSSGDIEGYKR